MRMTPTESCPGIQTWSRRETSTRMRVRYGGNRRLRAISGRFVFEMTAFDGALVYFFPQKARYLVPCRTTGGEQGTKGQRRPAFRDQFSTSCCQWNLAKSCTLADTSTETAITCGRSVARNLCSRYASHFYQTCGCTNSIRWNNGHAFGAWLLTSGIDTGPDPSPNDDRDQDDMS